MTWSPGKAERMKPKAVLVRRADGSQETVDADMDRGRRTDEYVAYIASSAWQAKRRVALQAAGFRCQMCNAAGTLDVHHRTYERFGNEQPGDLTVLCRGCHDLFHGKRQVAKRKKQQRKRKRADKKARAVGHENDQLRNVLQRNKLKQKLARDGRISPVLRADLVNRERQ